jgi:hypothetical protein
MSDRIQAACQQSIRSAWMVEMKPGQRVMDAGFRCDETLTAAALRQVLPPA